MQEGEDEHTSVVEEEGSRKEKGKEKRKDYSSSASDDESKSHHSASSSTSSSSSSEDESDSDDEDELIVKRWGASTIAITPRHNHVDTRRSSLKYRRGKSFDVRRKQVAISSPNAKRRLKGSAPTLSDGEESRMDDDSDNDGDIDRDRRRGKRHAKSLDLERKIPLSPATTRIRNSGLLLSGPPGMVTFSLSSLRVAL